MGEYGLPKAFLYWYKSEYDAPTEYIYIIAFSIKQANLFFYKRGYGRMADYSLSPIDEIEASSWLLPHEVGDILGQYATI